MKSETTDKKGCMRIVLFSLTFIDAILIYAFFIIDWYAAFLFIGVHLFFCAGAILCMFKTYRLRNTMEKVLFFWSLTALSALPIAYGLNQARLYFFPPTATFDLPDGESLTVTTDKLEWGKKNSTPTSYINLGEFNMDYWLAITKGDTLFVWPSELTDSVHSQRYTICRLPEGCDREKGFDETISNARLKWKYDYKFMYDGIFTGGDQRLSITKGDSIYQHWRTIINKQRIDRYDMSGVHTLSIK